MSLRYLTLALALSAAALTGCDSAQTDAPQAPPATTTDPEYTALLDGVGGVDGLVALLQDEPDESLTATLAEYGMGFETIVEAADGQARFDIRDCPQRFPTADRVKWFRLVGAGGTEYHYVDSRGRPATAYKSLGPVTAAPRQSYCQTTTGNWASPARDYDGGHMIGSQLGGWGGRANIVPQQFNFNRGNWKRVEDAVAKCSRLGTGAVQLYVDVDYSSSSTLTPSQFHADVKIGGVWQSADFTNTAGGGPYGASEASQMVSWLQGRGCY